MRGCRLGQAWRARSAAVGAGRVSGNFASGGPAACTASASGSLVDWKTLRKLFRRRNKTEHMNVIALDVKLQCLHYSSYLYDWGLGLGPIGFLGL